MARNSKVILAKGINLDNTYSNVLNYTEEQMLNLLRSQDHLMYNGENYSFIRENENQISVQVPYDICLQSNYLAFQNTDYSNKWFFCFIKDVKYTSEKTTTITYDVDVFSTWFSSITVKPVFIEREHVNDDTIGLHTVPEGLETGDYINQEVDLGEQVNLNFLHNNPTNVVLAVTELGLGDYAPLAIDHNFNSIFSGLYYLTFPSFQDCYSYIRETQRHLSDDNIVAAFMCPSVIAEYGDDFEWESYPASGTVSFRFGYIQPNPSSVFMKSVTITKPTVIDKNYQPKNNKLLTFPYVYLTISNNGGAANNYMYEYFTSANGGYRANCPFDIRGSIGVGCSIKLTPIDYKLGKTTVGYSFDNYIESLDAGKLPTCSWTNDAFINYLTANAVNIPLNILGNTAKIIKGGATGKVTDVVSGVTGITSQVSQIYERSLTPETAKGGINQSDFNFSQHLSFSAYKMSIKEEFGKIIDDYFTRFGYQINRVKTPNITGRRYWNFVKIGASEDIGNGSVPNKFKESLNNIFRTGTTIWHSHDNIGNFNLNNTIL